MSSTDTQFTKIRRYHDNSMGYRKSSPNEQTLMQKICCRKKVLTVSEIDILNGRCLHPEYSILYSIEVRKFLLKWLRSEFMTTANKTFWNLFIQHMSTWVVLNTPQGECIDTNIILWTDLYFKPDTLNV